MKSHMLKKFILTVAALASLVSCCPKDGIDRSKHDEAYNIVLDIQNKALQKPIDYLDHESKLVIVFNNGSKSDSRSFEQGAFPNRYTFYFDSSITDQDVSNLEIRLIDYKDQILDFKTVPKTPFQRESIDLAKNTWDGFFCDLNLFNLLLPQANAMSCRVKAGSKLTWRSGYLIALGLLPED